jgi:hypothetical protein
VCPSNSATLVEDFQEIEGRLFLSLVGRSLSKSPSASHSFIEAETQQRLEVALGDLISTLPVLVSRNAHAMDGQWVEGLELSANRQMRLRFVEFFDWDQLGFMSGALVRARIESLDGSPELHGHDVMIEIHNVRFLYDET